MPVEIPIPPSPVFGSSPGVLHRSVGGGIGIFAKAVKRFTETNKWRDPWYRNLSSPAKQLWEYLRDNCDAIGLVEIDLSLASGDCGQQITDAHVSELGDRIQRLSEKKLFLTKFIAFQYGELNSTCPPHRTIIKLVSLHCLVRVGLHYRYPNATVTESPVKSEVANNQQNTHYPNARVATTLQDKTRLEKDPDKKGSRQEGDARGNGELDPVFVRDLKATYRRTPDSRLSHLEESTLAEIVRERPRYRDEWDTIVTLKQKEPRYFPQSLSKLLSGWQDTLDRANCWVPEGKPVKSLIEKALEQIQ